LSEQFPSEAAPPEEAISPPLGDLPETDEPVERRGRSGWIAPAWFFFGIIVGIVGFATYNAVVVKPAALATAAQGDPNTAMKVAAREGFIEALATMQAAQQQPAAQEPQAVASNAFTVRAANRQGNPDAKVTIYEFSDFQ
jgi:hypothetical protein